MNDAERGVYHDEALAHDLAFIGLQSQYNTGLFMDYSRLEKLWAWRDAHSFCWAQHVSGIEGESGNAGLQDELTTAVGTIWREKGLDLAETGPYAQDLSTVHTLLLLADLRAPKIRAEGGGSRLPTAVGDLYFDSNRFTNRAQALEVGCGVPKKQLDMYAKVVGHAVTATDLPGYLATARQSGRWHFEGAGFLYSSRATARASLRRPVKAAGKEYLQDFVHLTKEELGKLKDAFEGLVRPKDSDWEENLGGGREGTQSKAMGGWNALGAAAFYNYSRNARLDLGQNWEWLHVRGAQVGGVTKAGNLVPGTFAANSRMIPYENLLNKWRKGNPKKITARFRTDGGDGLFVHAIIIEVAATNHPVLGTIPQSDPLTVEFHPLDGTVTDKLLGRLQKTEWVAGARRHSTVTNVKVTSSGAKKRTRS